jgi:hypothetical protein
MPIDLTRLHKFSDVDLAKASTLHADDESFLVLIKLRPGAERPSYVTARANVNEGIFSALVTGADLKRLEFDPSVQSVSVSQQMQIGR